MSTRPSSKHLRRLALERDDHTCSACGLREPAIMHVDHKVPRHVAKEAYDNLDNLVTLCPNDHARKTVRDRETYPLVAWNKGKKLTLAQKANYNLSGLELGRKWATGRKFTDEHRAKLSAAHKARGGHGPWNGKKLSVEHRQKLREAKLRRAEMLS